MIRSLLVFFVASGCPAILAAQQPVSFAKQVRPFFSKYCVECHNSREPKAGLILESYKDLFEGSNKGTVLVPGKPLESRLVKSLDGKTKPVMPPEKAKFHPQPAETALVVRWVAEGAKDDSHEIKVAIPDIKARKSVAAPVAALAFHPESGLLAAGRHKLLQRIDLAKDHAEDVPQPGGITALAFSANGEVLAAAIGNPGSPASVHLRTLKGDKAATQIFADLHTDVILDIAISPDSHWLATASYDTRINLTPLTPAAGNARVAKTLKEHSDTVYAVAFSPDSKLLASCSADRAVKVWHVDTGKLLYTLGDANDWLYTLAWSPDGAHLASGGVDRSIRVYRLNALGGKLVHSVFAHEGPVQRIVYSKDGKSLYSLGQDKSVKAWDAERMVEQKVYGRLPETGLSLAIRGQTIAVGLYDGTIQLIDAASGKARLTPSALPQPNPGKRTQKSMSAQPLQSPDADKITPASGERGKTIRVILEGKKIETADEIVLDVPGATGRILTKAPGKIEAEITLPETAPAGLVHIRAKNLAGASKGVPFLVDPFPVVKAIGGLRSPGTGEKITLPASIVGTLDRAGMVHYFRFDVEQGQELGVQVLTKILGSKVEPFFQLTDTNGKVLAEATNGSLGHTFAKAGTYAIGIRDRDLRGGADFHYRLHLGDVPVVNSLFPLGGRRGTEVDVQLHGVFLGVDKIRVKIPLDVEVGSKVPVPLSTKRGKPLGPLELVAGEFPESLEKRIAVPGTGNGILAAADRQDVWTFTAKKGERLVLEVHGRRLGSPIDSVIEVLDAKGNPVPRVMLRCQAKTFVTFRDHDSAGGNIRLETWGELAINDLLYVGSELMKIKELPTHPDADCNFFSAAGQRIGYLDTTPTHHAMNEPMYKVSLHPPGTKFPANGYPVFTLNYRNDDGGPGFGRDSRLFFDPPADGDYQVRITDARGQGGPGFGYRLTVRPPRPSFNVRFSPTDPVISRDGAGAIGVVAERIDGFDGPIAVAFADLPPGFHAPNTTIEPGEHTTAFSIYADESAATPLRPAPLRLVAHADIGGQKVSKEAEGKTPQVMEVGEIVAFTEQGEVAVKPGGQVKLTVHVERRHGFVGRVPLEVRGLPHGVRVLDIGLNGILVNENEVRRTIVIYAEPWVEPTSRPFVILARREGKNTEHAAKSVLLKVTGK